MVKNYLKIALRNLFKYKAFSFINALGLAISMSVCLLVIMLIRDAYNFDLFHPQGERVYRILTDARRKAGGQESYASSPYPVGMALSGNFSGVEAWSPLVRSFNGAFRTSRKELNMEGFFAGSDFFKVFGFRLAQGDPATALAEPQSVVLTHETAERFFKTEDPLGQILENNWTGSLKVTGVLEPFPGKTHLEFEALCSISTLPALERMEPDWSVTDNWNNYYMTYNFVRLRPGAGKEAAEAALADIAKTAYQGRELEARDAGYRFRLQALQEITPGPLLSNTVGRGAPAMLLWFLTVLCIIVMASACFNYTNLTVARAFTRTKEVGVRKVMGATRGQVFGQFMGEALVTAGLAFVLGYGILELTIPFFKRLQSLAFMDVTLKMDWVVAGWFLLFVLAVGLFAGLLPAAVLSKFQAAAVLQKLQNLPLFRRVGLRKTLLVTQFAVSLLFIILLTIAWRQMSFATRENFGAGRSDILNVEMGGIPHDKLVAEISRVSQVQDISAASHLMGTWRDSNTDVRTSRVDEPVPVRDYFIDHRFIPNFGLELIAGENFPENPAQRRELFAIVNEKFLERFQLGAPAEALNRLVILDDSSEVAIRGVVKNFLFKPLSYSLEPLLLRYDPAQLQVLNLKISGDPQAAIAALESIWKTLGSPTPPEYSFYDDTVRETFADLRDILWVVGYFGAIGILIACLGLLGMAIFTAETRSKEISIRKVVGASPANLAALLSKGYFLLLLIAMVIALPVSYLAGNQLLQTFAYHIALDVWAFLPGVALLFLLGAITVGSQTLKAARANPVDALRKE